MNLEIDAESCPSRGICSCEDQNQCPRETLDTMFKILSDRLLFPEIGRDAEWFHLRDARNWLAHHIGLYIQFPASFLLFALFPPLLTKKLDELEVWIFSETNWLVRELIYVRYRRWVNREITSILRMRVMGHGGSAPFAQFWEMYE